MCMQDSIIDAYDQVSVRDKSSVSWGSLAMEKVGQTQPRLEAKETKWEPGISYG